MTYLSEEDVQAIAKHTSNLKTVARDVRLALTAFNLSNPRGRVSVRGEGCPISGCTRESYWRGYCFAHYCKRRRFMADVILPASWVENAPPGSVPDASAWDLKWAAQKGAGR